MKTLTQAATVGTVLVATVPVIALTQAPASAREARAARPAATTVTAVTARGRVHAPVPLRVRGKANRLSQTYRRLTNGTTVALRCSVTGQRIYGNRTWYRLTTTRPEYVAAHYVTLTRGHVPHC